MDGSAQDALVQSLASKVDLLTREVNQVATEVVNLTKELGAFRTEIRTELQSQRTMLEAMMRMLDPEPKRDDSVSKLELVAMQHVVVAARRARMLKGGSGTMLQLAEALEQLDAVQEGTDPGTPAMSEPELAKQA